VRTHILLGVVSAAVMTAGAASAATKLEIKDAVVRVIVIPENRGDVKVETMKRNGALPMDMRVEGDTVVVDGNLKRNAIRSCFKVNGKIHVTVRDKGSIDADDMPVLVVHTPMDVSLKVGGAVFGEVKTSYSVDLGNVGCGDWTVADTRGKLFLRQAGSGDVVAGRAGALQTEIAGSGDVTTGPVATDVDVAVAGSGDTHVASVNGQLKAKIAGSGDVRVEGGRASAMSAQIAGSGDVSFDGVAGALNAQIAGSGDVTVQRVDGPVAKRVMGSGEVHIG
jgi:Putative auto-transporter adhesin, head GIN domain